MQQLWKDQERYLDHLEEKLARLKELEDKNSKESSRREALLVMRLTSKEAELQEMTAQIAELKSAQAPSSAQLRQTLIDPAVNLVIQKMTKECDQQKKQAEEAQNELAAWKFTPDSATGKRLMAKCRQLYQENEDLGKMIASGRLAKLEGELALQKNLTEEMKKNQQEMDEFMAELDEDVEGMQSTIYYLQQQLREARETIAKLENSASKAESVQPTVNGDVRTENKTNHEPETNGDEEEEEELIAGLDDSERFDSPEPVKDNSRTESPRTRGLRTEVDSEGRGRNDSP